MPSHIAPHSTAPSPSAPRLRRFGVLGTVLGPVLLANAASHGSTLAQSTFEVGPEGWTLPQSTIWSPTDGNPGGFLYGAVDAAPNVTAAAFAPAAFLGSWLALDGVGELRYDYRRISNGGPPINQFLPLTVTIRGGSIDPGGVATWNGPTITAPTAWATYTAPISEAAWTVTAGTWNDILSNVTEVRIQIELVNNGGSPDDKAGIDNVVLGLPPALLADLDGDGGVTGGDLGLLLAAWGSDGADLNCDGTTDGSDLGILLSAWTG